MAIRLGYAIGLGGKRESVISDLGKGISDIGESIEKGRLAKAKQQLESSAAGRLSIKALALGCGYRHTGLFSTDFKRRFGVTPSEVRRPPLV